MKQSVLLLSALFIATAVYAQSNDKMSPRYGYSKGLVNYTSPGRHAPDAPSKLDQKDVINFEAVLFNPSWQQGYVIIDEDTKSNIVPLQYSVYSNQLLFVEDGKSRIINSDQFMSFVLINDFKETLFKTGFTSKKYDIKSDQPMRVIYEGTFKLLAKESAEIIGYNTPRISRQTTYYLVTPNNNFKKIKLNKRDILEALDVKTNDLNAYAVKNNLNFNKESDLKKILSYYNRI